MKFDLTAEQLVDKFINVTRNRFEHDAMSYRRAKVCAKMAVEMVLDAMEVHISPSIQSVQIEINQQVYNKLKQELEKL
jgi:hypothetical protein